MKSEDLFRVLGDIDDALIQEVEESESRRSPWFFFGTVAAIAAIAIGTVWFTDGTQKRPTHDAVPPDLAAPVATVEPSAPVETTVPDVSTIPDHTTTPDVSPKPSAPNQTVSPVVSPGPSVPDKTTPPDLTPAPSDPPVQPSPRIVPFEVPTLPGFADIDWPEEGPHEPPLQAEYVHNDEGDFIVFTCPVPEMIIEPIVFDITGQIEDGRFSAFILDLFDQPQRLFALVVYDDGTYDLYWDHDPYNDTEWWLESQP